MVVLVAGGLIAGCGAATKCGPGTCTGCCDATGACQGGNTSTACGSGGLLCGGCALGQICSLGLCVSAGTGGGTSSGGGSGGGAGGGAGGGGGGGFAGGVGGGSGTAFVTWCSGYAASLCDFTQRCGIFSSSSACRASSIFGGIAASFCVTTPAMRDGRTVFDAASGAACVNQLTSGPCDALTYPGCATILRGTGALNAACYGHLECVDNLYCDLSSTCPGVCRASTPVGQVAPPGVPCATGGSLYGTVCLAPVPIGQSCAPTGTVTADHPCVAGAFCSAAKVCTAQALRGQSCTSGVYLQCAGLLQCVGGACGGLRGLSAPCDSTRPCQLDLSCGATNVCVPLGSVNAACTGYGQCQATLFCDLPTGATAGTCQPWHTLGQSCTYVGSECSYAANLYCTATSTTTSGVCAMRKGLGASCQSYTECVSSNCTNSICTGTAYDAGCVAP